MSQRSNAVATVLAALVLAGCAAGPGTPRATHSSNKASDDNVALAQQYIQNGQYEVAKDRLEHALRLDPRSANAHTMMGVLNERLGRDERAGASYRRAAELQPERGDMLNNYGTWLCRAGRPIESLEWFDRALADPFYGTPDAALANAGSCARQAGQVGRAEQYLRRALDANPAHPGVLQDLAALQFQLGEYMRARAFVQRRQSAAPVDPDVLELAARIEEQLGNAEAARRYRSRIAAEFPDHRPATPGG